LPRWRPKKKAINAVGRSILVITWYLLSDPEVRSNDLGSGYYDSRISPERKKRSHIRELEALGYKSLCNPPPDQVPEVTASTHPPSMQTKGDPRLAAIRRSSRGRTSKSMHSTSKAMRSGVRLIGFPATEAAFGRGMSPVAARSNRQCPR
jgi:hypothetical protein